MVSTEKITRKFSQLDEYLRLLRQIAETPQDAFLKDKILLGSAKYYLQVSIECCLDIANRIIAAEQFRPPRDYADTFKILEETEVLSPHFARKLMMMAKFRNRLVHLYGEVDDGYIYEFIKKDLNDIDTFKKIILKTYLV